LRIRKDAHPESANGGGGEGFFSGLTLLYSSAPRGSTIPWQPSGSLLFLKIAGCHLTISILGIVRRTQRRRPLFSSFPFSSLHTLPSSVSCKSCICHCYENCRVYTTIPILALFQLSGSLITFQSSTLQRETSAPSYPLLLNPQDRHMASPGIVRRRGYEGAEVLVGVCWIEK